MNHQMFKQEASNADLKFGGTGGLLNLAAGYGSLINSNVYLALKYSEWNL